MSGVGTDEASKVVGSVGRRALESVGEHRSLRSDCDGFRGAQGDPCLLQEVGESVEGRYDLCWVVTDDGDIVMRPHELRQGAKSRRVALGCVRARKRRKMALQHILG